MSWFIVSIFFQVSSPAAVERGTGGKCDRNHYAEHEEVYDKDAKRGGGVMVIAVGDNGVKKTCHRCRKQT